MRFFRSRRGTAALLLVVLIITGFWMQQPRSRSAIADMCSNTRGLSRQWGSPHKLAAIEGALFAMMAHNAYGQEHVQLFQLPADWQFVERVDDPGSGLSWTLYALPSGSVGEPVQPARLALALRGTDDWRDWWRGTFSGQQYEDVLTLVDTLQARYPEHALILTGHSLGGGLALHASLHRENVAAYAFNPSPLVRAPERVARNRRVVYWENEDILHWARALWHTAPDTTYWRFAFAPDEGHDSNALAYGLLALSSTLNPMFEHLRRQNCETAGAGHER